jgi:hypothetical protein
MGNLDEFVPNKDLCLEMCEIPVLYKMFSETLYIWGAAGVQLRHGSELAIPAPTLQEMLQLLRTYNATITFEDEIEMFVKGWYLTLAIGEEPVAVYNITSVDEMARACITLMSALTKEI